MFGLGLNNLLGGKLTVLALSQIGAENPSSVYPNANGSLRYFNDLVLTYKATDKLTFVTEGNYIRDDYFHAEGYGAAQYVSYALSDQVTLNGRAEVWRDNNGFYVTRYPGNLDAIKRHRGRPNTLLRPGQGHLQRVHRRPHLQANPAQAGLAAHDSARSCASTRR